MRLKFKDRVLTRRGLKVCDSLALRFWPAARGPRFYAGKSGDRLAARTVEVVHDVQTILGVDLLPNAAHHAVIAGGQRNLQMKVLHLPGEVRRGDVGQQTLRGGRDSLRGDRVVREKACVRQ